MPGLLSSQPGRNIPVANNPTDQTPFTVNFNLVEEDFPPLVPIPTDNPSTTTEPKTITVQAQVIHTLHSQPEVPSSPGPLGGAHPPNTTTISNVATYVDLDILPASNPALKTSNISNIVPTETHTQTTTHPIEAAIVERKVEVEKVMMMGHSKGKTIPVGFPPEPSPVLTSPQSRGHRTGPIILSPEGRGHIEPTMTFSHAYNQC
ncbi:hypothetical protein DPEC_G00289670 [Dallia pectoralis]|uniref:Uncharacterized protein n=1 Tax=Dallia pectoralis TaxID=75939 RepID=A0ACC2FH77_DALPE|nr:hypothetical protein DPEC_G00289670 [Dallia pectoralis]